MSNDTSSQPTVPFVDLQAQMASIRGEVDAAIKPVLDSCAFVLGDDVQKFESEFAAFVGAKDAVGCASGTDAIHIGLRALGIGAGDEVILPAMTFIATALGVTLAGAKPVLVDVLPESGLMDPGKIEAAITFRTRAIMPVHLFGQMADMPAIRAVAARHGLLVVEDAAQAHGAMRADERAGSASAMGFFSFYPGKNLGASGDGGLVTCADSQHADTLRMLRNWGSRKKYHHEEPGLNSRLDTIQAAILRVKLRRLANWNDARRRHARRYDECLAAISGVTLTQYDPGSVHHLYVVRVADRDRVLARMGEYGLVCGIHYPFAVHELQAYRDLGAAGAFPVAEDWARRCLSLPMYAELPASAPERAASALREILAE